MDRVAFIINPNSAKKNGLAFLKRLNKECPKADVFVSDSKESTAQFIREKFKDTDLFVAVGGDGTISSVAEMLIDTDKILAVFPAGSGNGFSHETHFNSQLSDLLNKIQRRNTRYIDTIRINEHISINVSGAGYDGKIAKEFEKTSRGFLNYVKIAIKTYFTSKPVKITFHTPEFTQFNGKYLMLNVANTRQFGNFAYIAPDASKSDGKAEIVLVKRFPFWYAGVFAAKLFTKKLNEDSYISFISTPEADFSLSTKSWHVDGDYKKIPSPVNIKVQPGSLRILC